MAQKTKFNFKEKEGKFFAPIVGQTNIVNGVKQDNPVPKSGVKGVYAKVRLQLTNDTEENNATKRTSLFAISSETFISSK